MYNDKDFNFDLLKGMNAIMISMNNEDAYNLWIYTFPDCADDDEIR